MQDIKSKLKWKENIHGTSKCKIEEQQEKYSGREC